MNQPATAAHLALAPNAPAYVKHAKLKAWVAEIGSITSPDARFCAMARRKNTTGCAARWSRLAC